MTDTTSTPITELAAEMAQSVRDQADALLHLLRPPRTSGELPLPRNQERAARCQRVLYDYADDMLESNLVALLTDAMHWSRHTGTDFQRALQRAERHFRYETMPPAQEPDLC